MPRDTNVAAHFARIDQAILPNQPVTLKTDLASYTFFRLQPPDEESYSVLMLYMDPVWSNGGAGWAEYFGPFLSYAGLYAYLEGWEHAFKAAQMIRTEDEGITEPSRYCDLAIAWQVRFAAEDAAHGITA